MKKLIILFLILQSSISIYSQNKYGNILSSEKYFQNPSQYLSSVDSNLLKTNCLLDRSLYPKLIMDVNGIDRVRVLNCAEWMGIQRSLKQSIYMPKTLPSGIQIKNLIKEIKDDSRTYSIGIIDYKAERINKAALIGGQIIEGEENLIIQNQTTDLFNEVRIITSSILAHNITGDQINFIAPSELFLSNIQDENEALISIEMNFNNGDGFIPITLDEKFTIDFKSSKSDHFQLISRLTYEDKSTGEVNAYYTHESTHRTGTSTVPIPNRAKRVHLRDAPFPNDANEECYPSVANCDIKYTIMLHPDHTDGKLRRPFIVTDGFDPGNYRSYYENNIIPDDDLPYNHDFRGLYQFVNGDPSPWETEPSAGLIGLLQDNGFDIVFIDFTAGAGDIPTNGESVRGFLKDVINGSGYRDAKTEESIVVGPSMGGLITRYALKTMEDNNEEHLVKTWIAFDSPMKGANIPISLQETVDFFSDIQVSPNLANTASAAVDKLNSTAARQLLLEHFDQYYQKQEHNAFYNLMDNLGYPDLLKRYTITCGGGIELYNLPWFSTDPIHYKNLDFEPVPVIPFVSAHGWALRNDNTSTSHKIFQGWTILDGKTSFRSYNIGFDNSPGGYNTALYNFNCHYENTSQKDPELEVFYRQYLKASFIPTSSALGIEMDETNIYKTWHDYSTYPSTPFDVIHGMEENEEHVNISQATASSVINYLEIEFNDGSLPYFRSGQTLNKSISAPVAYTYKNSVQFGGNGNTVTFKDGADVNIKATDYVRLIEGVSIKQGAIIKIIPETVSYSSVFRSNLRRTEPIDPLAKSPFKGKLYDYSKSNAKAEEINKYFNLFPNPVTNNLNITALIEGEFSYKIFNINGQVVKSGNFINKTQINTQNLISGSYLIKIRNSSQGYGVQMFTKESR